eukprot:g4017.t1
MAFRNRVHSVSDIKITKQDLFQLMGDLRIRHNSVSETGETPSESSKHYSSYENSYAEINSFSLNPESTNVWARLLMLLTLGLGNMSDAVEVLCIGFILTKVEASDFDKGLLSASVFCGMLLGGAVAGFASDQFGRRPILLTSLCVNAVAAIASSLSPNVNALVFCRTVAGFAVGGSVPCIFTLVVELSPQATRGRNLILVSWFWMCGAICTAATAWLIMEYLQMTWHFFACITSLPAIFSFFLTYSFLPESPRWLKEKSRSEKEVYPTSVPLQAPDKSKIYSKHYTFYERCTVLLNSRFYASTLGLCIMWFSLSYGSYGMAVWLPSVFKNSGFDQGIYTSSILYAAFQLPGNIGALMLVEQAGRKKILLTGQFFAVAAVLSFAFTRDTRYDKNLSLAIILSCMFSACATSSWNIVNLLSTEAYPTNVRSTAMGTLSLFGRVGSIIAQFCNGYLVTYSVRAMMNVTALMMIFVGVAIFLLPQEQTGKNVVLVEEKLNYMNENLQEGVEERDLESPLSDGVSEGTHMLKGNKMHSDSRVNQRNLHVDSAFSLELSPRQP